MHKLLGAVAISLMLSLRVDAQAPEQRARTELLLLVREGALVLPAGTYRSTLDELPRQAIDAVLLGLLRGFGVLEVERVVKRDVRPGSPSALAPVPPEQELYHPSRLFKIVLPDSVDPLQTIDRLRLLPTVVFAEPNGVIRSQAVVAAPGSLGFDLWRNRSEMPFFPNDPIASWGLYNPTNRDADIGAPEAWDIQTGSPAIRISFFDTGGEPTHQDLGGSIGTKLVAGYDFVNGDADFLPDLGIDDRSHGMAAAGVAAALTNNSNKISGVCGGSGGSSTGCGVLMAKILGTLSTWDGIWNWLSNHHLAVDAVYWSINNWADVTSNSWCSDVGAFTLPYTVHAAYRDAYAYYGVLNVAAMGNTDLQPDGSYSCNQTSPSVEVPPAAYSDIMVSVGATDQSGTRVTPAAGRPWESGTGPHIDLTAPGLSVSALSLNNDWRNFNGTSAAVPFVSGTIGLVLSEIAESGLPLYFYDVPEILRLTATDRFTPG